MTGPNRETCLEVKAETGYAIRRVPGGIGDSIAGHGECGDTSGLGSVNEYG